MKKEGTVCLQFLERGVWGLGACGVSVSVPSVGLELDSAWDDVGVGTPL